MKMKSSRTMDMVNGPLLKNIFLFSIPLMLTNFLQMMFNAADTVIVGKFAGQQALAAVGATGSICFLLMSIFNGLSMGSNVIIAQLIGSKNFERIEKAVHTAMTMAAISGACLAVIGGLLSKTLLGLMDTPSDIIDLSALYMRIYFCGVFFMLIYNFGASILRAKGDTQRPLYFLAFSGVLNVCLNLVFVVFFKMSVAGVALATVISNAVAAILVCKALMHETDATHLEIKKLGIVPSVAWDIIRIGVPTGIQGMVFSLSNVVIQSSINSFGSSTIVAGNSAGANIESFVYIGMVFSQATVTFTSQNIGAGNKKQVKKILLYTLGLSTVFGALLGILVNVFGSTCLGFYTNDVSVIEVGLIRLKYVALFLALNGILDCFVASMRGMGFSSTPTIFMLLGICAVRLCWIAIMFPIYNSLECIYLCYPLSWTITSIVQFIMWTICYKKIQKGHFE